MYMTFDPSWCDGFGTGYGMMGFRTEFAVFLPLLVLLFLWWLFAKGLALWHASQRNEPYWFIAFLVVNTLGILELFYLMKNVKSSELFKLKKK